ncbi:MAG TPA: HAD family hydrolase [Janthinobacterium sp.]|nr:HAD family hydrolase [Janthinobacterium sp.]
MPMTFQNDVVFLVDVDNTLLDNDQAQADYQSHLQQEFGAEADARYWQIYHQLFDELGYADYLGALQRFRLGLMDQPKVMQLSAFFLNYPFVERVYPGAVEVLRHLSQWGPVVLLSDGDAVFQPRKIDISGLGRAVDGRALIYVHKEDMLAHVERHYPARRYVMIDDKLRVLDAMKNIWQARLITVFPRQGHYAFDEKIIAAHRAADVTVERIGDLINHDLASLLNSVDAGQTE